MDLYRTLDFKSNLVDSSHFENKFQTNDKLSNNSAKMNEPSKQRPYWRYYCSFLLNNGEVIIRTSYLLLRNQRHRATIMPSTMKANGNFQ